MGVKGLGDGFEVNEAAGKLKVRVGDGAIWIFSSDEEARDVVWPFDAPQDWNVSLPALPGLKSVVWESRSTCAFARCIVMAFH